MFWVRRERRKAKKDPEKERGERGEARHGGWEVVRSQAVKGEMARKGGMRERKKRGEDGH